MGELPIGRGSGKRDMERHVSLILQILGGMEAWIDLLGVSGPALLFAAAMGQLPSQPRNRLRLRATEDMAEIV